MKLELLLLFAAFSVFFNVSRLQYLSINILCFVEKYVISFFFITNPCNDFGIVFF